MEDKARFVAVSIIRDIEEKKSYSNLKLNEYFVNYDLNSTDRGFVTELLYGTIRWKLRIDYLIQKNIRTRLDNMNLWVLSCIRTAIYQIYFMDKVPDSAAVNEAVNIVKTKEEWAAPLVNGVLRNILRNKEEFYNIGIKNKTKRTSIEYSHPEWFVKKFTDLFGTEFVNELMKVNNTPPKLTIRVNTLKITSEELLKHLSINGFEAEKGLLDESLILKGYSMIEKSKEFKEGYFLFQDESSMLVARVLDPKPGERIIDLCSAPGGKTTHIAQLMGNKGEILAFDIHRHKIKLIEENSNKLGIEIIKAACGDALELRNELKSSADRVLVDAPCSGLGLIRKKPEIRWNINENDIIEISKLQYKILTNASKYLKDKGILVYSTCTITEEENEAIINRFLSDNPNFKLESVEGYVPEAFKSNLINNKYIKLFPNVNDCDGFFISRLRREW